MTLSFCFLTDTKQSPQYTIKTHSSGSPMPKFEANMNYMHPSPPRSIKGYELVPEAYRQKFRNCKKDSNQTHVEFARNKEQLFDR